jgi:hypothetical protein
MGKFALDQALSQTAEEFTKLDGNFGLTKDHAENFLKNDSGFDRPSARSGDYDPGFAIPGARGWNTDPGFALPRWNTDPGFYPPSQRGGDYAPGYWGGPSGRNIDPGFYPPGSDPYYPRWGRDEPSWMIPGGLGRLDILGEIGALKQKDIDTSNNVTVNLDQYKRLDPDDKHPNQIRYQAKDGTVISFDMNEWAANGTEATGYTSHQSFIRKNPHEASTKNETPFTPEKLDMAASLKIALDMVNKITTAIESGNFSNFAKAIIEYSKMDPDMKNAINLFLKAGGVDLFGGPAN